jgi:hypothetical protein
MEIERECDGNSSSAMSPRKSHKYTDVSEQPTASIIRTIPARIDGIIDRLSETEGLLFRPILHNSRTHCTRPQLTHARTHTHTYIYLQRNLCTFPSYRSPSQQSLYLNCFNEICCIVLVNQMLPTNFSPRYRGDVTMTANMTSLELVTSPYKMPSLTSPYNRLVFTTMRKQNEQGKDLVCRWSQH